MLAGIVGVAGAETATLRLVQTIPLPQVEGRIDHMAVDVTGQRLFVAALGNHSLEVIDLRTGKRIHSINGLREPQGVVFLAEANRIYVACGGDDAVKIYDAQSFALISTLPNLDDADNIRYDAATKRMFVGYGVGAITIIDTTTTKRIGDIKLAAHPESFQLEQNGNHIFVNVPTAEQVAVVDREKCDGVATWKPSQAKKNFPMALDEAHRRLFVGCREPAALIVFDADSGIEVGRIAIDGDTDDVFYDGKRDCIYLSCGAGFIDTLDCKTGFSRSIIGKIPTARGARTSLFVPELDRLYLAVPHRGAQPAEIRVYEPQSKTTH